MEQKVSLEVPHPGTGTANWPMPLLSKKVLRPIFGTHICEAVRIIKDWLS